jgi:hypothetical protein
MKTAKTVVLYKVYRRGKMGPLFEMATSQLRVARKYIAKLKCLGITDGFIEKHVDKSSYSITEIK